MKPGRISLWLASALLLAMDVLQAEEIEKISLPLIHDLQRADLYVLKFTPHPSAVLVLSPGFHGNGKDWIQDRHWQDFARTHNLGLVGLSFASEGSLLKKGQGYYYPSQGSGQLLLDGIDRAFDPHIPLLLYGFSGGAHFTSGFIGWKPHRVKAWCSYSAEWWTPPSATTNSPPGLVVCGDEDERYGASLIYFKQGRALGLPWLWIGASNNGHWPSSRIEDFVRRYFDAILLGHNPSASGEWVDIDLITKAERDTLTNQPSLTGWLPDAKLFSEWRAIQR